MCSNTTGHHPPTQNSRRELQNGKERSFSTLLLGAVAVLVAGCGQAGRQGNPVQYMWRKLNLNTCTALTALLANYIQQLYGTGKRIGEQMNFAQSSLVGVLPDIFLELFPKANERQRPVTEFSLANRTNNK